MPGSNAELSKVVEKMKKSRDIRPPIGYIVGSAVGLSALLRSALPTCKLRLLGYPVTCSVGFEAGPNARDGHHAVFPPEEYQPAGVSVVRPSRPCSQVPGLVRAAVMNRHV